MEEIKKLSFIIPCYGSEKTVGIVIEEIDEIVSKNRKYEGAKSSFKRADSVK